MTTDKRPKCGAVADPATPTEFECGSYFDRHGNLIEPMLGLCIPRQRDQLAAENAALRERVKRLEEAGDFMELCLTHNEPFRSDAKAKWHKAKESKP